MSTKFFILTSLLSLTSAIRLTPAQRRQNTECWQTNPGTTFFRCGNGYVGCFAPDSNVCDLPPLATPTASSAAQPTATNIQQTMPLSYNIYPQSTSDAEDAVPHVDLLKTADTGIVTTNALVFNNVPANAVNCRLQWRTEKANDKSLFIAEGNALVYSRQLLGFPTGKVNFESLKPFQDTAKEFSAGMDFTGWESMPQEHMGPSLECAEQIAVEMRPEGEGEGQNRAFIANTKTNGMFLSYDLV